MNMPGDVVLVMCAHCGHPVPFVIRAGMGGVG